MTTFSTYLKIKNYSQRTIDAYTEAVDKFLAVNNPNTVTQKEIVSYLSGINGANMKNTTIAALNLYFKVMLRSNVITKNPMSSIGYQRTQRKSIIPISADEMKSILNRNNFLCDADYILIETMYVTGMRVHELQKLKTLDINTQSNTIKTIGKGNKERILSAPEYVIKNLIQIAKDGVICPYSYDKLRELIASYLKDFKRAGLTGTTKLSSHVIRHSVATHLLKSGANIMSVKNFLSHSSVATTALYTHLDMEFLKAQHGKLRR